MSTPLHLAPFQSFQCQSTGRCCRNTWAIRVESSAHPAIMESQTAEALKREGYEPLVLLDDNTVATGRRNDGACVFLTDEELCSLHAELGGGRKPLACQAYPYSVTATPDGYFASLSFACPTVVAGIGGELEANRQELDDLLTERGFTADQLPYQVEVVAGRFVSWECYKALEEALRHAFQPADPVASLLSAAAGVVQAVSATPTDPQWPDLTRVLREEGFEESMLAMFCASVIALWELPEAPHERQAFSQAILMGELVHSQVLGIPLPAFDLGQASSPLMLEAFGRYFENAIFGKSLLIAPVVSRLLILACGYAMVMHYGEAFRQAAGASEIDLPSLARAFELVEADLVTHTRSADPLFAAFEGTLVQAHEMDQHAPS